jgi:hypothetical protein
MLSKYSLVLVWVRVVIVVVVMGAAWFLHCPGTGRHPIPNIVVVVVILVKVKRLLVVGACVMTLSWSIWFLIIETTLEGACDLLIELDVLVLLFIDSGTVSASVEEVGHTDE